MKVGCRKGGLFARRYQTQEISEFRAAKTQSNQGYVGGRTGLKVNDLGREGPEMGVSDREAFNDGVQAVLEKVASLGGTPAPYPPRPRDIAVDLIRGGATSLLPTPSWV